MICPTCHGKRNRLSITPGHRGQGKQLVLVPCDYCHGRGHIHCCEGDRAAPRRDDVPSLHEYDPCDQKE